MMLHIWAEVYTALGEIRIRTLLHVRAV